MGDRRMAYGYLSDQQLAKCLGVHRVTIWRWVRECGFPEPIRLTRGTTRWRWADVEAWLAKPTDSPEP